jgi:hypothetical protein
MKKTELFISILILMALVIALCKLSYEIVNFWVVEAPFSSIAMHIIALIIIIKALIQIVTFKPNHKK